MVDKNIYPMVGYVNGIEPYPVTVAEQQRIGMAELRRLRFLAGGLFL